ncbi:Zn-dependent exopeptidase [Pseudovirgaria hyperparasitica]|uniref:Zn-dependent exopeptidase n=1 Tax=Pseudovirgaria hyperparasitica TaxID=470096 RepID=A0A6A6WGS1_9PEZI|nr:Zn-dependent exopeptidase [Pseudovirgaria hyperparasitica]KAF2761166.1 Zn-dependent exopeptidase [Pseudovirgaria hyperparasitica]
MPDEKHPYEVQDAPIPSYEEATSSNTHLGPREVSDDAERQGLLQPDAFATSSGSRRRNGYYQPPSVQSVRNSEDSDLSLPEVNGEIADEDEEEAELRRELHEMDIDDEEAAASARRGGGGGGGGGQSMFSKRISSLTTTLSRIQLPKLNVRWLTGRIRMPSVSDRYRPSLPIIARLFGLFLVVSLVYLLFVSEMFPGMQSGGLGGQTFNPEWVRKFAQGTINTDRIRDNLKYITSYDHVAGTKGNYELGTWIERRFQAGGLEGVMVEEYEVYLNYPVENGRKVSIVEPADKAWDAKIEEPDAYVAPGAEQSTQQTLAYHGLSKRGSAQGPLIYAHYGSREDFKRLADKQIKVEGAIVMVRAGGHPKDAASKVKAAQEAGAVGCLIYTDPSDDGFVKGKTWPEGKYRPQDSLERSSVALTSYVVGDVLTPGDPSRPTVPRKPKHNNPGLVKIPSLPLSWSDAKHLIASLEGHGEELQDDWRGGAGDEVWWSGNEESPIVRIQNEQSETDTQKIHNVIGYYHGYETPTEKIIVGNHRDSWCFGAADPGSGTAVMLEVVDTLGQLQRQGWRPARSIVFASWDAAEYNLMGSTEFVEDHIDDLRSSGVAYINVDNGVSGDNLHLSGSPLLERAFTRILGRVSDPVRNKTFSEIFQDTPTKMTNLDARGDYVPFQSLAGMTTLDFGFRGDGGPLHSCYETYEWMLEHVDPDMHYHTALAQIWVLLILDLAQEPMLPFHFKDFSDSFKDYVDELEMDAIAAGAQADEFDITPLRELSVKLERELVQFMSFEDRWYSQVLGTGGFESRTNAAHRWGHNSRAIAFESHLLDWPWDAKPVDGVGYGIPGREQYKHVLFGPSTIDGEGVTFPFIRDALEVRDWKLAMKMMLKTRDIISRASETLLPGH